MQNENDTAYSNTTSQKPTGLLPDKVPLNT